MGSYWFTIFVVALAFLFFESYEYVKPPVVEVPAPILETHHHYFGECIKEGLTIDRISLRRPRSTDTYLEAYRCHIKAENICRVHGCRGGIPDD